MPSISQEIILTRTIFASPAQVYAAFTRAEGWCMWCCEKAEAEARIGGKLHIYTDGYNAYGEFICLEENKAAMTEALRRLQVIDCTRVFSTAHDKPADALYHSVMQEMKVTDTWVKQWNHKEG